MKTICSIAVASALIIGWSGQASADLIAHWTFETSIPTTAGPHAAEAGLQAGVAAASGFRATGTTTYSNPVGNGTPESFSSNNWTTVGDYYQFQVNLTGFSNATISWEQTRSSTGPASFELQYSVDGTNFNALLSYAVDQVTWSSTSYTVGSNFGPTSLTSAVDNQSTVYVRLSSTTVAAAATGTNRIDDVRIEATPIPEPGTFGLLGLALAGLTFIRPRR